MATSLGTSWGSLGTAASASVLFSICCTMSVLEASLPNGQGRRKCQPGSTSIHGGPHVTAFYGHCFLFQAGLSRSVLCYVSSTQAGPHMPFSLPMNKSVLCGHKCVLSNFLCIHQDCAFLYFQTFIFLSPLVLESSFPKPLCVGFQS